MGILRFIFTVLHLGIIGLLVGTLLNKYIAPTTFGWLNLLSLGFPILMILNVLFCLFWMITWRKRAIFFLITSLLFIVPTRRWINYTPESKETADFKLLIFNTKNGTRGESDLIDYIQKTKPDILMLQETTIKLDLEDYPYQNEDNEQVKLYSKFPFEKSELIDTNVNTGRTSYNDITIKGKKIRFINLYMEPFHMSKSMVKPTGNLDSNERKLKDVIKKLIPVFKKHQTQLEHSIDIVENSPYPVVFAGDFNAVPNSYEYYKASKNLQDAFVQAGRGSGTSFHDFKVPLKIDHIFTSTSIKPLSYKVDRTVDISDHFPILATFKIN